MKMSRLIVVALTGGMLCGCWPTAIPMSSEMNAFLQMNIKPDPNRKIALTFASKIIDGKIVPYQKDKGEKKSIHYGYNHTENATLERMIREYIGLKYPSGPGEDIKVEATLEDFWLEEYSPDTKGSQTRKVLFGGEVQMILKAVVVLQVQLAIGEKTQQRRIKVTAEETYVQGYGTYTSSSLIHKGQGGIQFKFASAINKANNKAMMMLDKLLGAE